MKTLLKQAVIWVAVGVSAFFLSCTQAGSEIRIFPGVEAGGQKETAVHVWVNVDVQTVAGSVKILCSIPIGKMEPESTCITAREETFIEKNGALTQIAGGRILAKGPSVKAASQLAADAINRILSSGQIQGKTLPREFLRPQLPARRVSKEEL